MKKFRNSRIKQKCMLKTGMNFWYSKLKILIWVGLNRKPADSNFIQIARIDEKLAECRLELDRQLDELSDIILNIPETDIKAIMMCRYMLFLTHAETAKALDYDNHRTPKRRSSLIFTGNQRCRIDKI